MGSITAGALRTYHRTQFVKSRMLLVIVGNVPRGALDSLVSTTLATLPAGSYRWTLPDTIPHHAATVYREPRQTADELPGWVCAGPARR